MARKYKKENQPTQYSIMWLIVMFDLPVVTQKQMRIATKFRNSLLELGFMRKQFSVYMRHCENMLAAENMAKKVGQCLTDEGNVSIFFLTDRQYGLTRNYYGKKKQKNEQKELQKMEQLFLF